MAKFKTFYTTEETAQILKVDIETLRDYIRDNKIKVARKNPGLRGRIYFDEDGINEFLEKCAV